MSGWYSVANWAQGPWPWAPGPTILNENEKRTVNENPKRTMNENAKNTVNENAKRTMCPRWRGSRGWVGGCLRTMTRSNLLTLAARAAAVALCASGGFGGGSPQTKRWDPPTIRARVPALEGIEGVGGRVPVDNDPIKLCSPSRHGPRQWLQATTLR